MTTKAKSAVKRGAIVVVAIAICCGTLSNLLREEDFFPYAIRTDGKSIFQVHDQYVKVESTDILAASHRSFESASIPKFTIKSLPGDLEMLTITSNGKSESIIDTRVGVDAIWDDPSKAYYFVEQKEKPNLSQKWIVGWDAVHGFRKLSNPVNYVNGLAVSLDGKYLVSQIRPLHPTNDDDPILTISIRDGTQKFVECPSKMYEPIMISENEFLLQKSRVGNSGLVVRWRPGSTEMQTLTTDKGDIAEVVSFNGNIWALMMKGSKPDIVRLDSTLTRIEEDLGWIESKSTN
ncbi:MAG: hypothetical protein WCG75_05510 [Armatimonadota bacterium]